MGAYHCGSKQRGMRPLKAVRRSRFSQAGEGEEEMGNIGVGGLMTRNPGVGRGDLTMRSQGGERGEGFARQGRRGMEVEATGSLSAADSARGQRFRQVLVISS